jgi:phosphohistidine phosphatase SixA
MRRIGSITEGVLAAGAMLVLAGAPLIAAGAEVQAPTANLAAVLGNLKQGGYVLYFRHTTTDTAGAPDADADLARCESQRNLSTAGRAMATRIGRAMKALAIPVGGVVTSPFCRTRETAELAFGKYTVSNDLYFVLRTDARETRRLADALRGMLSAVPPRGTNSIVVAHSANLREAAGIFASPEGVAYVFKPLGKGQFEAMATILPEEWDAAVKMRDR